MVYNLKKFSRVVNHNLKRYKEVVSSGRISDPQRQAKEEGALMVLDWAKMWVDKIRKTEKPPPQYLPIEFVAYAMGYDEKTVMKMYELWKLGN